jgi:hypothetical protein
MPADRRRARRLTIALSLLFAFIVWNGVFDARIAEATRQFTRQRDASPDRRPVRIDLAMHSATVQCAWEATVAGIAALAVGLGVGTWWSRRAGLRAA